MTVIQCSGKSHPNAGKGRAVENCKQSIEVESPSSNFKYLCRKCSPVAPPPPNTFTGKQFDNGLRRRKGRHEGDPEFER
jgi:hypothetical protein